VLPRQISPRLLAVGAGGILLLVVVGLVLARGLPFGRGSGVDRIVTLAQSRNGDTSMVLMHSDGSDKVTLVDEAGVGASSGGNFYVSYAFGLDALDQARGYGDRGAAVLASQKRILFWYPTPDGMEIRSSDLDGGDVVKMAQASPATQMLVPAEGDKVLLVEQEQTTGRLMLMSLRGQATPLVQDALELNAVISPDGKHIAYSQRDEQGRYKLTVMDTTGANAAELARDLRGVDMHFSADSSKLFFTRRDEEGSSFAVANADGQNSTILSRSAESGRGDVAGGRLIYEIQSAGETSLFTSDLNGDDRIEIARGAEALFWGITRDRKQIIFTQKRNGRFALQISDLQHEQVQDLKRGDGWLLWRPLDDGRLLVTRYGADSFNSDVTISTVNADGSDEQVLKRDLQSSSVAIQGDTIVVAGQVNGQGTLVLFGGKEPVTLDDEADSYGEARIAPDGRIIYTARYNSGPVLYAVDSTGKSKKLLAEDATILACVF
jgi:Tol biopolymer transport system component